MVGQKRFGYFRLGRLPGFSKVTRRQGGTLSSRYRSNGYVLNPIQKAYLKFVRNIPDQMDGLSDAPKFPTSFPGCLSEAAASTFG